MPELETTKQNSPNDLEDTNLSNRTKIPPDDTKEKARQADINKEIRLALDKWIALVCKLVFATTYLTFAFVTIVLVEKGVVALITLGEQNQTLLIVKNIADAAAIIMYVIYLFVVVLSQLKHLLATFSL